MVAALEDTIAEWRPRIQKPWDKPVEEWKSRHPDGKVIGCFPVYSPVELITAAGCLPVGIFGAGTNLEIQHADARFVSFVCSIAKSTLELGFQNCLDRFDGFFFHSICDVARNLSTVVRRNFPRLWSEYIHFPQNRESPSAVDYYEHELMRIQEKLERLTGRKVTSEKLQKSIALYNECRRWLNELYRLRREHPGKLSTVELNVLARAFTCMPPDEAASMLREACDRISSRPGTTRDRITVVLEGSFCEPPPLELLETIEDAGCSIIDDDLVKGWRWFTQPIPLNGNPLRQLAASYLEHSDYSSVRHDWKRPRFHALVEKVRSVRADAVLFAIAKFCEPALFDYVPFKEELDRAGIPHLMIEYEEKMWTFERVRNEIETFVESILFE